MISVWLVGALLMGNGYGRVPPGQPGALQEPGRYLSLAKEFTIRQRRLLAALSGNDPETLGIPTNLDLARDAIFTIPLADATTPPFRQTGKAFAFPVNLAAVAAQLNMAELVNAVPGANAAGFVAVIDAIDYGGNAVLAYGIDGFLEITSAVTAVPLADTETQPGKAATPYIAPTPPALTGQTGQRTSGVGPGATFIVGYVPSAAISVRPSGLVIWPGERLVLWQLTVNVALTMTVHGRLITVGTFTNSPIFVAP